MTVIAFDTHKFVRRLKESGMPEPQAEAIADPFKDAQGETEFATKQDIAELKQEIVLLRRDMQELAAKLSRDLAALETKLTGNMQELDAGLTRGLVDMDAKLTGNMRELETKLSRDLRETEMRLTIKLGAMLVVAIGVVATLVKLL